MLATLCSPLFSRLVRIVRLSAVAIVAKSSVNPTSVILTGISDISRPSYRTFHSVGPMKDPSGLHCLWSLVKLNCFEQYFSVRKIGCDYTNKAFVDSPLAQVL